MSVMMHRDTEDGIESCLFPPERRHALVADGWRYTKEAEVEENISEDTAETESETEEEEAENKAEEDEVLIAVEDEVVEEDAHEDLPVDTVEHGQPGLGELRAKVKELGFTGHSKSDRETLENIISGQNNDNED